MLDWLVVGGGIHGTLLSRVLTGAGGVASDRIAVLDPHAEPLAVWDRCAAGCQMKVMRSPSVHNLDLEPFSLRRFSELVESSRAFVEPYHRPHLALFRAHCGWLIERHGLMHMRRRATVTAIRTAGDHLRVETSAGVLEAARIVLAIGGSAQPRWPAWATRLRGVGGSVEHIFEDDPTAADAFGGRVAIIGGGISAAQLALALHEQGERDVAIIARHAARLSAFDIDAGWLGPRLLTGFARVTPPSARRTVIAKARKRGSMPKEIWRRLRRLIQRGEVQWHSGEVQQASRNVSGGLSLDLGGGGVLACTRVVLATGFEECRPGAAWLDDTIDALGLTCGECGYPIVDGALRWHPRIHVSGALAELEIGPAARNIAGARMAAARIVATA